MTHPADISAIVLSAGVASQTDDFKPLLRFGELTALERSVRLFQQVGTEDVRVIIGYRSTDLVPLLQEMPVTWVVNERFEEGIFSSIKAGIKSLHPSTKGVFLLPVEVPLVRVSTIRDLIDAFAGSSADATFPCFRGEPGNPPLISTNLFPEIQAWNGTGGLSSFLRSVEHRSVGIEVADRFIGRDRDTPESHDSPCERFSHYQIPSPAECMVLLVEKCSVSKTVMEHSLKVAEVSLKLAGLLRERGRELDEKLLVAAALLHDLAKGLPDHGAVAARILRRHGFDPVADLVEDHMDCTARQDRPIDEFDILRISDRITEGDRVVDLEERFRKKMELHAGDLRLAETIQRRFTNSKQLRAKVQQEIGQRLTLALSAERSRSHGMSADDLFAQAWCNRPSF